MRRTTWVAAIGLAVLVVATSTFAAEEEQPSGWEFDVVPYFCAPGGFNHLQVRGRSFGSSTPVGEALHLFFQGDLFFLAGFFEARYDRFSVFADAFGGFTDLNGNERIQTRVAPLTVGSTAHLSQVLLDV